MFRAMDAADVVAGLALSLDGYIAAADGSVGFLENYPIDEADFEAFVAGIGGLITGSTTYEQAVGWGWLWGDLPTMVLTTRPDLPVPEGADVRFSAAPTAEAIRSFSAATPKRLWVFGGARVIGDGLRGGAIDTLDLTVVPEVLGKGIPLFNAPVGPLRLESTKRYASGAVRLIYHVHR
jgi:dihydrofolate reductase